MDNEKMDGLSMDIHAAEQDKLRELFPQCFTEGQLDERKFLQMLGVFNPIDENDREKYEFRWKGKQEALALAGKRSAGTLRPCMEESVNFDTTQNLYIEGDNLEVLKILQTAYFRKVKMIYIDPPYNTGNDFVYADDFADPLARYREVTQQTTKSNPESMGRFHTNWLNMMYPRLRLASNLLRDDGVIFISIDDGEVHNLRKICDEIFGEENFVGDFIWKSRQIVDSRNKTGFSSDHESILVYAKRLTEIRLAGKPVDTSKYSNPDNDPRGPWMSNTMLGLATAEQRPNLHYPITNPKTGIEYPCNPDTGWRFSKETMAQKNAEERILFPKNPNGRPREKKFLNELENRMTGTSSVLPESVGYTLHGTKEVTNIFNDKYFDFPKPVELIKFLINQGTNNEDGGIILDFFSGSATTAHAVTQLNAEDGGNRCFICVQLPEGTDEKSVAFKAGYKNICEIGKERIRRAGAKIYEEGIEKWTEQYHGQQELTETVTEDGMIESGAVFSSTLTKNVYGKGDKSLDTGFKVFKLDSSNLKMWDDTSIIGENSLLELEQRIYGMLDIIKPDRTNEDVVYEVMLKLGQQLTQPIMPITLSSGRTVYGVGMGDGSTEVKFIVCLAYGITPEDADEMAEYAPGRIVFADSCFDNSEQKSNVRLTLKDKGISIKAL